MFKVLVVIALSTMLALNVVCMPPLEEQLNEYALKDVELFIEHFGHDAISFLRCMGPSFVTHCPKQLLACLTSMSVIGCIGAISCESHDANVCIHHLREVTSTTKAGSPSTAKAS